MVGKILKYGVIVGLLAVLVGGTVYILARPAEAQAERGWELGTVAQAGGVARGNDGVRGNGGGAAGEVAEPLGQGAGGQGSRRDAGQGNRQGVGQGAGGGVGGPGTGNGVNAAESKDYDWQYVQGIVSVTGDDLTVQTPEGEVIVGMGQLSYREQAGFVVAAGDEVAVYGFYEDGEFKAGTVENLTTGASITLRDAAGRPMWAGNGNQRNRP
ncbi:MAG: hypothetical protein JXA21_22160 [Anaerolineae bacterium]|nr:hypothetical protein [Anaerolineae bacterium]